MPNRSNVNQTVLVNAGCLILLALSTITITGLYIWSERNFHWWIDWYAGTLHIARTVQESPSEGLQLILNSLASERNRLYTLPLVPFTLLFGESRLVYQVSLALIYLLPLTLVMGAIATQLIPVHRSLVFWSTAFLTLLIPVNWMSTLIGIPDTGGAVLMGLAAFIYLQDIRLRRWWRILLIGVLIGLAVLVRRHFVYGGIAFLGAVTVQTLFILAAQVQQRRQIVWSTWLGSGVRISLIAAMAVTTLWVVAPQFTHQAITTNYRTLYESWSFPVEDMVNLYAAFYGWGTWLMVAIGFSAGIFTRAIALPAASLIGLWGIFGLIIWLGVLGYANVFYALHITPVVIIGLAACIWTSWSRLTRNPRTLMLGVMGGYLVANLLIGLHPIGTKSGVFRPWFALNMPPLVRTDYDEVVRLVNYLRQLAPHQEPIYVVGYQRLQLSPSVVSAAEWLLYNQQGRILNILRSPQVDSRDAYPLETLLQAEYVVVPNPLPDYPGNLTQVPGVGEWLPNHEVGVVQVVFDAFSQNWEIAQDFQRLPVQFTLEKGAVANIYQRIRPTSLETAVRTLYVMQQHLDRRPGGQRDWIALNQPFQKSYTSQNPNQTYTIVAYHQPSDRLSQGDAAAPLPSTTAVQEVTTAQPDFTQNRHELGTSFLYLGSLPKNAEVQGKVTFLKDPCVKLSLQLAAFNPEGKIVSSAKNDYFPEDSPRFQLSIQGKLPAYLVLNVLSYDRQEVMNSCTLAINSLKVLPAKLL